jgi:Fe2+ or Zn2+ uptake regulation protein
MKIVLQDKLSEAILKIVESTSEPLETEEIVKLLQEIRRPDISFANATRTKVMYRLNNLRADGLIHGKMLGAGKGVWIWWHK